MFNIDALLEPPNNEIDKYDGYYVSYIPDQSSSILNLEDPDQDETALCVDGEFFILNGDWREQYASCSDLEEALDLFNTNKDAYASVYTD